MKIAVTGHRPNKIGGYSDLAQEMLIDFAADWIVRQDDEDELEIITGMALGWDQAVAEAAILTGTPFHAYIPFEGQELRWPESSQNYYRSLLKQAADVTVACTGKYEPWKMQARNEIMVRHCDRLVALWNGTTGGTANCVRCAEKVGRECVNLWPEWVRYTAERVRRSNNST